MYIPSNAKDRALWAREIIRACTASRSDRIQRGMAYRNLFLTGSEDGVPQTFLRTQDFIQDMLAMLYSPSGLRFKVDYFGTVSPADRAKANRAAAGLLQSIVNSDIDDGISDIILWALIKGKTIQQLLWSRDGLESYLIQPEAFGVYNETISDLKRQEAFVHTTFPTRSRFRQIISGLPREKQALLLKAVNALQTKTPGNEDTNSNLKQIIVGGMYPYQVAGSMSPVTGGGTVTHLFAPQPTMRPEVQEQLVPLDELWVWNDAQDDWATITMMGEQIVFGEDILFNAFSHDVNTKVSSSDENPLKGKHGFIEYSPMPLDGYFWGMSYVYIVALLQRSLNCRIDGINQMLRRQEDPPRFLSGSTSINQNAYAKLNKPGGYWTDGSPNAKMQDLAQQVPADIWKSFQEINSMFDIVGGFPPIMRGEGEGSVRSQGQSDTLLRTGAARHLNPALKIERSVERAGGVAFDLLRAKDNRLMTAWMMPGKTIQMEPEAEPDITLEPPAEGMVPIKFYFRDVSEDAKIGVDSHSSSPAFRHENRELAVILAKVGAITPKRFAQIVDAPMLDEIIEDADRQEIAHAKLLAEHPELLEKGKPGPKPKH
jgi:hypothetical protein